MASQKVVKKRKLPVLLIENRPIKIKVTTTNLALSIVEGRLLRDPASFLPGFPPCPWYLSRSFWPKSFQSNHTHQGRDSDTSMYDLLLFLSSVPGTGGSQLQAKLNKPNTLHWYCSKTTDDYFTLWLKKSSLLPFAIDCWADNMRW